ncbi:MAG: PQQ-binding-like beta-propeller repeat protein [Prolixibacteraceae bacterium]|nr:PQQ-binding-like beta-propeller repeat protein [Prolixibacteraceae bacterium]
MKYFNLFLFLSIVILSGCTSKTQTVAQWRGENRDGIYVEKDLLKAWPDDGPELVWETDTLGHGYSSPVIWKDKLFINGETDSISQLFAFDLEGNLLWKAPNGPAFMGEGFSAGFPGARSTPTVYNGLVYISSGLGRIACIDAETGEELWAKHMVDDLGGRLNYFGYCESLLADGNSLFCFPGGLDSNIVCLNRLTGETTWVSKALSDYVAFTSPMMIKLSEKNIFVTISKNYLMGLDASNGELLWSFHEDSVKLEGAYTNTPVYKDGFIYGVSGVKEGTGAYKLKLAEDGKSISEVWRNGDVKNETGGFIVKDNRLYVTSKDKKLRALDTETGLVADSLRGPRGSLIYADNSLYCYSDNGNVELISFQDEKPESTSRFRMKKGSKEHLAHPVIHDGVLYIRHGNVMQAYRVK